MPFLEKLQPSVLQQLQANIRNSNNQQGGKIPGKPGVDYPDFKTIPATDFTCENFILEGFYADTFTSCQVNCTIQINTCKWTLRIIGPQIQQWRYFNGFFFHCCRYSMFVNLEKDSLPSFVQEALYSIKNIVFVIGGIMSNVKILLNSMI